MVLKVFTLFIVGDDSHRSLIGMIITRYAVMRRIYFRVYTM